MISQFAKNTLAVCSPRTPERPVSRWWKAYFFVTACQIIGAPAGAYLSGTLSGLDIVNGIFIGVGLIGLYGYVFNVQIGPPRLWRIFLPIFLAWDIFVILIHAVITSPDLNAYYYIEVVALFTFLAPQYVALYRYGRSHDSNPLPSPGDAADSR